MGPIALPMTIRAADQITGFRAILAVLLVASRAGRDADHGMEHRAHRHRCGRCSMVSTAGSRAAPERSVRSGSRFDMETDAALILVLAIFVWRNGKAGPWVLLSGLLRYIFVAAGWMWPWMARRWPPTLAAD